MAASSCWSAHLLRVDAAPEWLSAVMAVGAGCARVQRAWVRHRDQCPAAQVVMLVLWEHGWD